MTFEGTVTIWFVLMIGCLAWLLIYAVASAIANLYKRHAELMSELHDVRRRTREFDNECARLRTRLSGLEVDSKMHELEHVLDKWHPDGLPEAPDAQPYPHQRQSRSIEL